MISSSVRVIDETTPIEEITTRIGELQLQLARLLDWQRRRADSAAAKCEISFISPCYNEAENLDALYYRVKQTCANAGIEHYEIIWIENGSADNSMEIMRRFQESDPHLRVVQLSRNFGYQGAIACGLQHSRGEWMAVLDADLQDRPELIPQMLTLAKSHGYDVVYGVRRKRKEHPLKRLAYKLFYRLWRLTAEVRVPLDAGDFGVMNRRVVDAVNSMPEHQRFIRGLRAWAGFSQHPFPYERDVRVAGRTKFSVSAMIAFALDGIVSYSTIPLRLAMLLGIGFVSVAVAVSALQAVFRLLDYAHVVTIKGILPAGLTQINLLIVSLFGLNFISLGILGEYVGRVYNESKARPLFIIRNRLP